MGPGFWKGMSPQVPSIMAVLLHACFRAACSCLQLNDRLSLGQHRLWKRMAVKWTRAKPGQRALDVCCGSGDLALLLADAVGPAGAVTGLDFAADMLQVGVLFQAMLLSQASLPRQKTDGVAENVEQVNTREQ
jgi:SAM-dependent methyltransferase